MLNAISSNRTNSAWPIDQVDELSPTLPATSTKEQQTVAANLEISNDGEFATANIPIELPAPAVQAKPEDLYMIIAMAQQLLSDHADTSLRSTFQLNNDRNNKAVTNLEEALKAVNEAKEKLKTAQQDLTGATKELEDAKKILGDKSATTFAAQNRLNESMANLETIRKTLEQDPDNPLLKDKYLQALAQADSDTKALNSAQADENIAFQNYHLAIDNGNRAADAALAAEAEVVKATEDYLSFQNYGPLIAPDNEEIHSALMTLLLAMAKLTELLSEVEANKLQNNIKLNQDMQERRLEETKKLADAYKAAVDAAKEKQEKRGRILKILNTLIMAAGVALAPFSGGFSMAVAAVTVSMYIADTVNEAKGLETPTEKMMGLVQEHFLGPMTERITNSIMETSQKNNRKMKKETAQIFASVLSSTTLMIVGMGASAGAAALMSSFAKAVIPAQTMAMLSKMENLISQSTLKLALNMQTTIGSIVSTSVSSVMHLGEAKNRADAQNAQGELTEINAMIRMLQDIMDQLVNEYCKNNIVAEIGERTSSMISDFNRTTEFMTRRISMPG